jgi:predicted dehydrogenase
MNIGLIGLGYWGKNLYRNLITNNQINNIYILDFKVKKFDKRSDVVFFSNKKKFFNEHKNIDAFIIATPASTHYEFLIECLKLDKHVCVTKPFTSNYNQIKKIKKNFKNQDKIFLDHTYLFHSSIRYMKSLIDKKKIGKLIYYDSERISFGKFYNDVDVIDDLAVHDLYILDYLLDGEMPNKIAVNSHNIFGNKNFISTISLKYLSGFFANIKVSWYSPIKSRRILLAGNKKIIEFDDNESDKKIKVYNKGIELTPQKKINQLLYRTGEIEIPNIFHKESLSVMINDLLKFSQDSRKNKNLFNHGDRVMKVLNQIKYKL